MAHDQVFLLSPARCDGRRAQLLLRPEASFDLAVRLRTEGAPVGEVFAFLSGLYFRGKRAYAEAFGRRRRKHAPSALVITTDRGLLPLDAPVHARDLLAFRDVDIASGDARYLAPLVRDVRALHDDLTASARVVLLGSIATGKYADTLLEVFGERLLFPSAFVGRGDMSRGGLLLRQVRANEELEYVPVAGAVRRGARPPKLVPLR
jgi:hypothetical protein